MHAKHIIKFSYADITSPSVIPYIFLGKWQLDEWKGLKMRKSILNLIVLSLFLFLGILSYPDKLLASDNNIEVIVEKPNIQFRQNQQPQSPKRSLSERLQAPNPPAVNMPSLEVPQPYVPSFHIEPPQVPDLSYLRYIQIPEGPSYTNINNDRSAERDNFVFRKFIRISEDQPQS